MGRRMQPRSETFFTLTSTAGPNVVESAAILTEFVAAPHERWAERATRMHDTEHAGDDTTTTRGERGVQQAQHWVTADRLDHCDFTGCGMLTAVPTYRTCTPSRRLNPGRWADASRRVQP